MPARNWLAMIWLAALSGCAKPTTYLGGRSIHPDTRPPVEDSYDFVRKETIYSTEKQVSVVDDDMLAYVAASYVCPGKRVPCAPPTVGLDVFVETRGLKSFMAAEATFEIDGVRHAGGALSYPEATTRSYSFKTVSFEAHLRIEVPTETFQLLGGADEVWLDVGPYRLRFSDAVLGAIQSLALDIPTQADAPT